MSKTAVQQKASPWVARKRTPFRLRRSPISRPSLSVYQRWQEELATVRGQFNRSFLISIREAIATYEGVAARSYLAWRLSRHVQCRDLADEEFRQAGYRKFHPRQFVYFLMDSANDLERDVARRFREHLIAVFEKLERLLAERQWTLLEIPELTQIEDKIVALGGVLDIYRKWLREKSFILREKKRRVNEAMALRRGVDPSVITADAAKNVEVKLARRLDELRDRRFAALSVIATDLGTEAAECNTRGIYIQTGNVLLRLNRMTEERIMRWLTRPPR
jgi:hypothetical protein